MKSTKQETQGRLQAEQAISQDLRKQLDAALRGAPNSPVKVGDEAGESKRMEMVKNLATAEQVAKDLRAQLDAKDTEFKRFRAESTSKQKQLEKVISNSCLILHLYGFSGEFTTSLSCYLNFFRLS